MRTGCIRVWRGCNLRWLETKFSSNMENQQDSVLPKDKLTPLYFLLSVIFVVWLASFCLIYSKIDNWQERGAVGDTFGTINSLFSGLAFAGIIYTILLQRKELALQRQELAETRKELKRSADAQEKSEKALNQQIESSKVVAKINAINAIIDHYNAEQNTVRERRTTQWIKAASDKSRYIKRLETILNELDKHEK